MTEMRAAIDVQDVTRDRRGVSQVHDRVRDVLEGILDRSPPGEARGPVQPGESRILTSSRSISTRSGVSMVMLSSTPRWQVKVPREN